jgi:heterodisulfide reductase subunit D
VTATGKLEQMREMAFACTRCGACREKYSSEMTRTPAFRVCPIREHDGGFEHHCARGKLLIAQGLLEGELTWSQELIDLVYTDPDCGLCTWVCNSLPHLDPPQVWRAMRRDLVASGSGPPEPLQKKDASVRERRNTFGARTDRGRWSDGLNLPRRGELLYFAGCYASYPQTEIARATVAILRKAGTDPAYLAEQEWCCGVTQFHDGSVDIAEEVAAHNVAAIESSGARTVLTSCAECYKSLKLEYPAVLGELPFEVLHVSEVLAQMLGEGSISLHGELAEKKVSFHDPCHLGRHCGVYEPPRSVLRAIPGIELVEMQRHRDYAWCCGHGADMVSAMRPALAREIARDRMAEARAAGAQALVTACPRCVRGLSRADRDMKVYDLTVAVARSMDLPV